jgi:hypothetical protein
MQCVGGPQMFGGSYNSKFFCYTSDGCEKTIALYQDGGQDSSDSN